eukprot:1146594-Pelagomonas_calceolata.AAC.3
MPRSINPIMDTTVWNRPTRSRQVVFCCAPSVLIVHDKCTALLHCALGALSVVFCCTPPFCTCAGQHGCIQGQLPAPGFPGSLHRSPAARPVDCVCGHSRHTFHRQALKAGGCLALP